MIHRSQQATLHAWFDLVRIYNLPIPLAGMLAGAYAYEGAPSWRLLVLLAAAVLGCAVTQSFNDYEDREVDAINAPFRPLPAGRLEPRSVLRGGQLLALLGAAMSAAVEPWSILVVLATYGLTRFYPAAKKRTLLNHLMMPAALALTPIYGSLVMYGHVAPLAWFAAGAIFFADINMNVVGCFKDLWDRSAREQVLPVVLGPHRAVLVALAAGLGGIAVAVSAVALGYAGAGALIPLAPATALTVWSRLTLYRCPSARCGYMALGAGRLAECLTFPALIAGVLPLDHALSLILGCMLFALYTQTLIPEAVLPEDADRPITWGEQDIEPVEVAS